MGATSRPRLGIGLQVGYGAAEIGLNAVETALRLYLLIYYTDVVGLRPGLAGLAVAIGLVFDAVTDPVMGAVSDRRRDAPGGRHVFVLVGAGLLATGVVSLFDPPALATQAGKFAWLLGSYAFLNVGLTVMAVPYLAMAGELTGDPHERSVLFAWRMGCANCGAVIAAALPAIVGGSQEASGGVGAMDTVGRVIAAVVVAAGAITWAVTRGARRIAIPDRVTRPFRDLLAPFANPSFRPLAVAYVVATIGIGVNATVALYYYDYRLGLDASQIQAILVVFMGAFTLSIVAWVRIARRCGKLGPLVAGAIALGISTSALYLVLPRGSFVVPLVVGGVGIGSFVGCIALIYSLLTDVVDHDRLRTGAQRAGVYFGLWRFLSKLARAVAVAGTGVVLDAVGFEPGAVPTATVERTLVWLFGPGVGGFFLIAGIVLLRYRFTRAKQEQVQRLLARRAQRD